MVHCSGLLLLGVARRRCDELENLVRHKCSVRELLSSRVDNIARAKSHLLRCDFCNRHIGRNRDLLGAVLVINYEGGTAAFLYRAVGHARVRCRARDGSIGHSAVSRCTWGVCEDAAFRSPTQLRGKYENLLRHLLPVRLLGRRDADIRKRGDMTQIGGYLLVGCEGLLDSNVDRA